MTLCQRLPNENQTKTKIGKLLIDIMIWCYVKKIQLDNVLNFWRTLYRSRMKSHSMESMAFPDMMHLQTNVRTAAIQY